MTKPKVLFVLTSHDHIGDTGKKIGWYLVRILSYLGCKAYRLIAIQPEFAHPYYVLAPHTDVTVASPLGGTAPLDPNSVEYFKDDPECKSFLQDKASLWEKTEKLSDLVGKAETYDVVYVVGGHGRKCTLH